MTPVQLSAPSPPHTFPCRPRDRLPPFPCGSAHAPAATPRRRQWPPPAAWDRKWCSRGLACCPSFSPWHTCPCSWQSAGSCTRLETSAVLFDHHCHLKSGAFARKLNLYNFWCRSKPQNQPPKPYQLANHSNYSSQWPSDQKLALGSHYHQRDHLNSINLFPQYLSKYLLIGSVCPPPSPHAPQPPPPPPTKPSLQHSSRSQQSPSFVDYFSKAALD